MPFAAEEICRNRDYFAEKLRAEKQRNDVLHAVENTAPVDFVLLDTRGKESFASGHIPGALCADMETLRELASSLRKDKEIVIYCWGQD